MNRAERGVAVANVRWTLNRITDAGVMPRIKYGRPHPHVAEEDVDRAIDALERAARRHFDEGGATLGLRLRRWVKAGCPATGLSARRLRETLGGRMVFKLMRDVGGVTLVWRGPRTRRRAGLHP